MTLETLLDNARECVADALARLGLSYEDFAVRPSARPGFGDVSCNAAFLVAHQSGRAPRDLALEIAGACRPAGLIERIEAHDSGHINFFADATALAESVICHSTSEPRYAVDVGQGEYVTIEHTSVNPNKALHIGHMRNVVVGDSISRILDSTNHRVRVLNYVDDLGLQVAQLVMGFVRLGFPESAPEGTKFDHYCGDTVYVGVTKKLEDDSELMQEVARISKSMEDASSQEAGIAGRVSRAVLRAQLETCWRVGASYDCLNFESHIVSSGLWDKIFKDLRDASLITLATGGKNDGCWVVPGSGGEDEKILVRSNGTATYIAKDIPYAAWKLGKVCDPFAYERYDADQHTKKLFQTAPGSSKDRPPEPAPGRVITIIDSRQTRLQKIIALLMEHFFGVARGSYIHLAYESVSLSAETATRLGRQTGGRSVHMSGRSGLYVSADSVLDMLSLRARTETEARNPKMRPSEISRISEQIAVGTMRYEMIRQDLDKAIVFDLGRSLRLDGDTASYMQYSHARAVRILEKAGAHDVAPDYATLDGVHERNLIGIIGSLGIALRDAATNLSPKVIARYSHDLTVAFNAFYEHVRVVDGKGGEAAVAARIMLVKSFIKTLEYALDLIGIPLPSRM